MIKPENNTYPIVSIQTTYKCNMQCANCYLGDMLNNDEYADLNIDMFEKAISKLPKRIDVRFIGAEPTMNDDLFEMIKIVKKYKHRPQILTNGLKLGQEDYVIKLKESGINFLGLSMNGGLDDEVYKKFDNGKYAKLKTRALEYCIKHKIVPHINIILDPTNTHIIKPLYNKIIEFCNKYNRRIGISFPLTIRIKSIAKMGNYLDTYTFNMEELMKIAKDNFGNDLQFNFEMDGLLEKSSCMYSFDTPIGKMGGKITDWTIDDDGIPLSDSKRRGILTEEGMIMSFFDYYGDEVEGPRKSESEKMQDELEPIYEE
jgi:sulfatase maturation enzyme AslB (radical SAM superfamily)